MVDFQIEDKNFYFIFPVTTFRSYVYSQFLFNLRKQTLGLEVRFNRRFSNFVFKPNCFNVCPTSVFFDYSWYFINIRFRDKSFRNCNSWGVVYNSFFFSFNSFSLFAQSIFMFSNLFVLAGFLVNPIFLKFLKFFYFKILETCFFFELCENFSITPYNNNKALFSFAMPTFHQILSRKSSARKSKKRFVVAKALCGRPHLRGVCIRVYTTKPKKPNSANRKVAKLRLSTGKRIIAYVHGSGNRLQQHSVVMVRGGRRRDLPGIHYQLLRGKYDFNTEENFIRKNRRSKFGVKKLKLF